jgi:hypothetical protein
MNENVVPGKGGWATIQIARRGRLDYVKAQISGPFAYHGEVDGWRWSVTHVRTGLRIPCTFRTGQEAARFTRRARELVEAHRVYVDTDEYREVARALREHGDTLRELAKDCDGAWDESGEGIATPENYETLLEDT